jgi:hypothetical protein
MQGSHAGMHMGACWMQMGACCCTIGAMTGDVIIGGAMAIGALSVAGGLSSVPQGEPLANQFLHRPTQPVLADARTAQASRIVSFLMVGISAAVAVGEGEGAWGRDGRPMLQEGVGAGARNSTPRGMMCK